MTTCAPSRFDCRLAPHRAQGVALVVVLCFVVLLSGLVVAYFSQVTAQRQVSDGSFNQNKADELARSALDIVVSGLKQEIADPNNSTALAVGSGTPLSTLYSPLTAASMLPARSGNPSGSPDPLPNLVRRSWRGDSPLVNTPVYSSKASAVNSTTDASASGRTITARRWNSHYLLPRPARADPTDSTPVSDFTPPDWVFVTNTGPAVITAPTPAVLGRYAYAIYDEGGLLDVNVAGFPTLAPVDQSSHKMALAYADLTQIGLSSSAIDDLVGWRNYASVQPTGSFGNFTMPSAVQWTNFLNFVAGDTTGFLKVAGNVWKNRTDQAFLSRQQLLKFRADENFSAYALQYLGTFSRGVGAPSWSPATTSPNIDYAGQKGPSSTNPDVLRVRVLAPVFPAVTTFLRADGTTAQVGEPLLKRRFPLNRLGGLSYQGVVTTGGDTTLIDGVPSPASKASVKRDFGLIWNADHWEYWGSTGAGIQSSIATLGSINDHEPNFFELLKAGILSGSLGKSAGPSGSWNADPTLEEGPASGSNADDANADLQIIRIGANIIDQSDADSYPTEIWFQTSSSATPTPCYGIENLPYLQRVFAKTLPYPDEGYVQGCYMAEVWNPHQPPASTAAVATPSKFQFAAEGSAVMQGYAGSPVTLTSRGQAVDLAQSGYIGFDATAMPTTTLTYPAFRDPIFLSNDPNNTPSVDCNPASGPNGPDNPAGSWGAGNIVCGLYAGTLPTTGALTAGITPGASAGGAPCNMVLKYLSPLGTGMTYKVYQRMKNLTGTEYDDADKSASFYHHPDPRTDRFGTSIGKWGYNPRAYPPGNSLRADTGLGWPSHSFFPGGLRGSPTRAVRSPTTSISARSATTSPARTCATRTRTASCVPGRVPTRPATMAVRWNRATRIAGRSS